MSLLNKTQAPWLLAALLMALNSSVTLASPLTFYQVEGRFTEPLKDSGGTVGDTLFSGTFAWDGTTLSNFSGVMNSSMVSMTQDLKLAYSLNTTYTPNANGDGVIVKAQVFKENTTDVYWNGGYATGDFIMYGGTDNRWDGNTPNQNAYFTFSFDSASMEGILGAMAYGDCTENGLMGQSCMTGKGLNMFEGGTMMAYASSLEIKAVPIPAAFWLFASGLAGFIGFRRRHSLI